MDMDYLKEQIDEAFAKERSEQEQLTNKFISKTIYVIWRKWTVYNDNLSIYDEEDFKPIVAYKTIEQASKFIERHTRVSTRDARLMPDGTVLYYSGDDKVNKRGRGVTSYEIRTLQYEECEE